MHIVQADIGAPKITKKKIGDNHALFSVAPLPNGYGMTLGNTFRRILLSSLPGAAVTAVKVKGATHEYTTLNGVQDSVMDMMLNLKGLHVRKAKKEPIKLKLEVKNREGDVTAKDITKNSDVEILNPELVITRLSKKGSLSIEITVEKGVGYLPAADRQKENREVGLMYLDAIFSPVIRVRYDVTATRVGQMTNLDKLELEVETSGSMTPDEALKFSSNLAQSYFALFNKDEEIVEGDFVAKMVDASAAAAPADPAAALAEGDSAAGTPVGDAATSEQYTPIEILGFSPRTLNALINGGIGSIEQLTKCTPNKVANLRGCGSKALDEVLEKLTKKGHKLAPEDESDTEPESES